MNDAQAALSSDWRRRLGQHVASGRRALLATAAGIALSGCAAGPNYSQPKAALPGDFEAVAQVGAMTAATRPAIAPAAGTIDVRVWWKSLHDPLLDSLVDRAVSGNFDLAIATARLQQAREAQFVAVGGAIAGLGSTKGIDISGAAGRGTGNDLARGRISGPAYSGVDTTGYTQITHVVGFDAGWELDLFGRYSRVIEASNADVEAATAYRNGVLIAVAAETVRSYVSVRALQLRLEIARENVAAQERTAQLVRMRFNRGIGNELDAVLAERQLYSSRARLAPLEAAVAGAERSVAVLCGLTPGQLHQQLEAPAAMPPPPPGVGPGMPVELLRRRPDILQTERRMAAATARVGIATANLFPRINLTAGAGFEGQALGVTPNKNSFVWSFGPSLYWPILDFGQLDAVIRLQDYQAQQAYFEFQRAVIGAVQEVDDALTNYASNRESLLQLSHAVDASRRAQDLATERYRDGLTDFLNVLDAQRQLFDLEDQYAVAQQNVLVDYVGLYKALGGGWEGYEAPPPAIKPLPAIIAAGAEISGRKHGPVRPE